MVLFHIDNKTYEERGLLLDCLDLENYVRRTQIEINFIEKTNIIETDQILTLLKICNCISVWCYYLTDNIDKPNFKNSAYTKWHHQFVRYEYEQQNEFYSFYVSSPLVHHETMNSFEESATGW